MKTKAIYLYLLSSWSHQSFADKDYLQCDLHQGNYKEICRIAVELLPNDRSVYNFGSDFPLKNISSLFKIKSNFACEVSPATINLFITADGGKTWAGPIVYGKIVELVVYGNGPLQFVDRTPERTKYWTFRTNCNLSIEIDKKIDPASESDIYQAIRSQNQRYEENKSYLSYAQSTMVLGGVIQKNIAILDPNSLKELVTQLLTISQNIPELKDYIAAIIEANPALNTESSQTDELLKAITELLEKSQGLVNALAADTANQLVSLSANLQESLKYIQSETIKADLLKIQQEISKK